MNVGEEDKQRIFFGAQQILHLRTGFETGGSGGSAEVIDVAEMLTRELRRFGGGKSHRRHVEELIVVPTLGQHEAVLCGTRDNVVEKIYTIKRTVIQCITVF